jgi:hypothetical protein
VGAGSVEDNVSAVAIAGIARIVGVGVPPRVREVRADVRGASSEAGGGLAIEIDSDDDEDEVSGIEGGSVWLE